MDGIGEGPNIPFDNDVQRMTKKTKLNNSLPG